MQVLSLVELEPIRGNIVGKPGESGLSVEQRKRLTIAVELVANPSIVFMDEPTSGAPHADTCMHLWPSPSSTHCAGRRSAVQLQANWLLCAMAD